MNSSNSYTVRDSKIAEELHMWGSTEINASLGMKYLQLENIKHSSKSYLKNQEEVVFPEILATFI